MHFADRVANFGEQTKQERSPLIVIDSDRVVNRKGETFLIN